MTPTEPHEQLHELLTHAFTIDRVWEWHLKESRTIADQAVREFAEKLKAKKGKVLQGEIFYYVVMENDIDSLLATNQEQDDEI